MRQHWKSYFLALSFALGATSSAFAADSSFTSIDYPGAVSTQAWGINPRGDIIGYYVATDNTSHGFLRSGSTFTAIDYPGAAVTFVSGINPGGDLVGEYGTTATSPHHGFLRTREGAYTSFDYPAATVTAAIGISPRGEIVGLYTSADNINHGFILRGTTFTSFDFPGATSTGPNGMNFQGDIVGGCSVGGVTHGFLLSAGVFTSFDFPKAVFTTAAGITPGGDIVGRYRDSAAVNHGFLMSHGQFTTIDFPGASYTGATSIDPSGNIVGRYQIAGVSHGFLMTKSQQASSYTVTDLGPVGGSPGQPFMINQSGLIAGDAALADGTQHAVLWFNGLKADIGAPGLGGNNSLAFGVNSRGQAVGQAETSSVDPTREDFCGFRALGVPATSSGWPRIRYPTRLARIRKSASSDRSCEGGVVHELPMIGTDQHGAALIINQNGQIIGGSGDCSAFSPNLLVNLQPLHAILWDAGTATDLGNLGGTGHFNGNVAINLNNQGQVVGTSDLPGDASSHAFLWTKETGMKDLGALPGDITSAGLSINDAGTVVGVSLDAQYNPRAVVRQNGVLTDLNTLIPTNSPLALLLACSINASGEIIGLAVNTTTGALHGYLGTPGGGTSASSAASPAAKTVVPKVAPEDIHKLLQGLGRFGVRLPGQR